MAPAEWQRVKSILHAVLDLPPAERGAFLENACADDSETLREVESLLASHEEAGDYFEPPVLPAAFTNSSSLPTGSNIGPYRIVQVIGEGGMGTVYQAVRADDLYRKLVALKVIRVGAYDRATRNKFDIERQILAHLDHPNIAKLLDGGVTPDGQPYFVMDFIAGTPIDAYCEENQLTVRERLKLFLTVCSAVHYAHQNLVIHRDLKPANILVIPGTGDMAPDGGGKPEASLRLLDFGIAKLIDPEPTSTVGSTVSLVQALTPEYASPEQLRNEPVTTASDIYSLGVLLYILLTGGRPYDFPTRAPLDVWKTICETEPRKPSLAAKNDRLARTLRGDLDNIVLMALRKEPERRYASVDQFARDIQRYLDGLPVIAHHDTFRYRTGKFVKRHWTGVIAAALILFTLIGGIVATSYQARVATREREAAVRRFNDVRDLANAVLFDLHDAIEPLPGSTKAREVLVKKGQQYLDKLAADQTNSLADPGLEEERALAYERIGDVLGLSTQSNLGKTAESLSSYQKSLGIELKLAAREPHSGRIQRSLMRTYDRICILEQSTGQYASAVANCQRAEEIGKRINARGELAATYQNLAGAYTAQGEWQKAKEVRIEALREFEDLQREQPEMYRVAVAVAHLRLAAIEEQLQEFTAAKDHAQHSIDLFEQIAARHPADPRAKLNITFALQRLGSILISLQDLPAALHAFEQVLPIREALLASDPADARAKINLANSRAAIGITLMKMGRLREALWHFTKQKELAEALATSDPMHVGYLTSLSEALENIGLVESQQAKAGRANADLKSAKLLHARECLISAQKIYEALDARNAIPAEYAVVPSRIHSELAVLNR